MTTFLAWSGAAGGAAVFIAGVWAIVRGIFRLAEATGDNTRAIERLTGEMKEQSKQIGANALAIARLQGRRR